MAVIHGIGSSAGPGAIYQRVQRETAPPLKEQDAAKTAPSPAEPPATDWAYEAGQYFAEFQGRFSGVTVVAGDFDAKDAFSLISGLTGGKFLFVGRDFIKAMGVSAEAFQQGKALLEDYAARLSAPLGGKTVAHGVLLTGKTAVEWQTEATKKEDSLADWLSGQHNQTTLIDQMRKAQEKAQEAIKNQKARFKVKNRTHLLNSATRVYSKLSRAPGQMQVRSVISSASYNMAQVKRAMANCDENERSQYQAVVGQLQRAIIRAKAKIQDLDGEQALKRRQQRAMQQRNPQKARQNEIVLKKRKSARLSKEYAYLRQSALESYLRGEQARQAQLAQYRGERMAEQAEVASGAQTAELGLGGGFAGDGIAAGTAPIDSGFTLPSGAAVSVSVAAVSVGM